MIFDSPTAVQQLQTLERQLAEAQRRHYALRVAWTCGDPQSTRRAIARAERHVRAMAIMTGQLKAVVEGADGLGALESLSELALRATRLVVLTELGALPALVHTLPQATRPPSWGRFSGPADLTTCVRLDLDRILDPCCTFRDRAQIDRPAYRAALHEAHAAMRRFGTASEFARFLCEGQNRRDLSPLPALCTRISIALTVRIDVEPDAQLVVCASVREDRATERAS